MACFLSSAESTWAKSLCPVIFHALRACGPVITSVLIARLQSSLVTFFSASHFPAASGESAEAPPAPLLSCCGSALLLGCICAGSHLLRASPQLAPRSHCVRLGSKGTASEVLQDLRIATTTIFVSCAVGVKAMLVDLDSGK